MFSCEYCEVFKNSFFIEHLWWPLLYFELSTLNFNRIEIAHYEQFQFY